jgi:PTS system fructose-specific IIC component/PTS system nitrogen regulatory IIA component
MLMPKVFSHQAINMNLTSTDKTEVLEELLELIVAVQPQLNRKEALTSLKAREAQQSTGIVPGAAIPHGICESVDGIVGALGISRKGIAFDSLDGKPTHVFLVLLSNINQRDQTLEAMRRLALLLDNPGFVTAILEQKTPQDICRELCQD